MKHRCSARGCTRMVEPLRLMCGPHWALVPKALKRRFWAAYANGDAGPTLEIIHVVDVIETRWALKKQKQEAAC